MPREKEDYRNNLELIIEKFPGKNTLTAKEVAEFLGRDVRTVNKIFDFKKGIGISIATLARALS